MSSIHDLVRNNDIDGVRAYIAMGKDLNLTDKLQRTGLHLAAWAGHLEILQMLIRGKADVSKKAMDAFTLLHFAATSSSPNAPACIEFIGKKARSIIHQRSTKGLKSALHLAIPKGRVEIIEALLDIGLDPLAKTSQGQTAVDLAKQGKNKNVIDLVVSFAECRGKQFVSSEDCAENEDDDDEGDEGDSESDDNGDNDTDNIKPTIDSETNTSSLLGKRTREPDEDDK